LDADLLILAFAAEEVEEVDEDARHHQNLQVIVFPVGALKVAKFFRLAWRRGAEVIATVKRIREISRVRVSPGLLLLGFLSRSSSQPHPNSGAVFRNGWQLATSLKCH
jgi:hypothetical protein